jgi:hypothetical protein
LCGKGVWGCGAGELDGLLVQPGGEVGQVCRAFVGVGYWAEVEFDDGGLVPAGDGLELVVCALWPAWVGGGGRGVGGQERRPGAAKAAPACEGGVAPLADCQPGSGRDQRRRISHSGRSVDEYGWAHGGLAGFDRR